MEQQLAGSLTDTPQPPARWPPDRILLMLANGCVGGSALLMPVCAVLLLFATHPQAMVMHHGSATIAGLLALVAFVVSVVSLGVLQRRPDGPRWHVWRRSLICHGIVVLCAVWIAGVKIGLALSSMEILAIGVHIVAVCLPALRAPAHGP